MVDKRAAREHDDMKLRIFDALYDLMMGDNPKASMTRPRVRPSEKKKK